MRKIILFSGGIETLSFFSKQLANSFQKMGYETFLFDLDDEETSIKSLVWFYEQNETMMISFNFNGIRGEDVFIDKNGDRFWDELNIPVINIIVDHPYYYHELIGQVPSNYYQICIDKYHKKYMERFYPHIKMGPFMPLAGTKYYAENKSIKDRKYDVVFVGNYTKPETFNKEIYRLNDDYAQFYLSIIDELLDNPDVPMEEVFERHCKEEMGDLSDDDLALCMANMIFIDLYVRYVMRGRVIATLADAGIRVDVFGIGFEHIECKHPENIIKHGSLDSKGCLEVQANAKISLNVMPWFKDGAHDRIFNGMINGSVSLTDDSIFLKNEFESKENIVFYRLIDIEALSVVVKELLNDEVQMQRIADAGYEKAKKEHIWDVRARIIKEAIIDAL